MPDDWLPDTLKEVESRHIAAMLERHGGNITHAATTLGITRKTLRDKIERHGLAGS